MRNILVALFTMLTNGLAAQTTGTYDEMSYSASQTTFRLNVPTYYNNSGTGQQVDGVTGASLQVSDAAQPHVTLRIYDNGFGGKPVKTVRMKKNGDNRWKAIVKGDLMGKFYTFDTGHGETPGVFAKAVGVNGHRGAIIDMAKTNPDGWALDYAGKVADSDSAGTVPASIYELHVRDFSIHRDEAVHKGKFLALAEPWATDYLRSLGISAVHVMPAFDFASIDETQPDKPQYNWGYDPLNYNVPEGSYSTDAYDPAARIREFKQMVLALHNAGIRVYLDVVYNHTFDLDHSNFQLTWPDAYYRFTADGKPSNGSGCGNETASERQPMRDFMLESIIYWVEEYHIDGFRFDLMGVHDVETMNMIRSELNKINHNIFVYGEGWSAGSCAYPADKLAMKANVSRMPGVAAFCDDMRDALRGPFSDDSKGAFLAGLPGSEESIKAGIAGMTAHPQVDYSKVNYSRQPWALEPTQMIAYVSCHDDMCLTDRLRAEIPGIENDELIRLDKLAQTAVFTSQGVPFLLSGEELLRTKHGVHNSYNSPDSINAIEWGNTQVLDYYRRLISLRRNHPAFRLGKSELVRNSLEFLPSQECLVGFRLKDHAGGDRWKDIIVILNANRDGRTVDIPAGKYTVIASNGEIDENGLGSVDGGSVSVSPQSALIVVSY